MRHNLSHTFVEQTQEKDETNYDACFFNEACVIICLILLLVCSSLNEACVIICLILLLVRSSLWSAESPCGQKYETNYDACFLEACVACFVEEPCVIICPMLLLLCWAQSVRARLSWTSSVRARGFPVRARLSWA